MTLIGISVRLKEFMSQMPRLKSALFSQVYKATGEEFLKIAGGQISVLLPSSLFTWCLEEDLW